jgi:hypothetical protein
MAGQFRVFLKMLPVIDPPQGRPSGRRRSSQIIEKVKSPETTFDELRFLWENPILIP